MKSSIILGLAVGVAAMSDASAQSYKAPDALHYTSPEDIQKQFKNQVRLLSRDSIRSQFKGSLNADSIRVNSDGSITCYGFAPQGILLDNRSESDSYIYNGTRYYIRNMKPTIEPKEVSPGSNIYRLK